MRILCTLTNRTLVTVIVLTLMLCCDTARCSELLDNPALYDPDLSVDFARFLSTLDKEVYGSKAKRQKGFDPEEEHTRTPIPLIHKVTVADNQNQKMGDALMMKLVSYYENKFKLSRPEQNVLSITELPFDLRQFTEKYFPTENHSQYQANYEPASPQVLGLSERPTPFKKYYQSTTRRNEMINYDDFEQLGGPSLDYPENSGFFEIILPGQ